MLQSFQGIPEVFPKVEEFSYRGEWSGREGGEGQDALRALSAWQATLRSLSLDIAGSAAIQLNAPTLGDFCALEHVRLHLHASRKHLSSLGSLINVRQLVFWGTDENTSDADLANKAYQILDFSRCGQLKVLAFRSMAFCHPEEQDHEGCMALSLPPSLEEMVVVNDIDPLSGLTPRLRRHVSACPLRLSEYGRVPNQYSWQHRLLMPIRTETQVPETLLWEVDASFRRLEKEEIEAARSTHLQMLTEEANAHCSRQIALLTALGLKPSSDAPFYKGEKVWYISCISILESPVLRRCLVRRVSPAPRDSDDEFAYDNAYLTYLLECRDRLDRGTAPIQIEADPRFIFRARPAILKAPALRIQVGSKDCRYLSAMAALQSSQRERDVPCVIAGMRHVESGVGGRSFS